MMLEEVGDEVIQILALRSLGLEFLHGLMTLKIFERHENLCEEGAPPSEVVVTLDGRCRMSKKRPEGSPIPHPDDIELPDAIDVPPDQILLSMLPRFTLVGDGPIFMGGGQPATVTAHERVTALTINWQIFMKELEKRPSCSPP